MATNRPESPAPVSGPGALSARTDGGPADRQPMRALPDAQYGEAKEFREIQQGAPMYAESAPSAPPGLFAPTERPDEPVTSGIASGPGDGPIALPQFGEQASADIQVIRGYLPSLKRAANMPNAPATFQSFVRYLETF